MLKTILSPKPIGLVMIALDILIAIAYTFNKDWRRVVYWLAGAVGITAITF